MVVKFEAYLYDREKAEMRKDPYTVSYSKECEDALEAMRYAVRDYRDYLENNWENYGGAVITMGGVVMYDALRNGDIKFRYKCVEELFNFVMMDAEEEEGKETIRLFGRPQPSWSSQ